MHFSCQPPEDFAVVLTQLRHLGSEKVYFLSISLTVILLLFFDYFIALTLNIHEQFPAILFINVGY